MDGEIGARLAELEADGLAEDTIVFYYSDNGGVLPRSKRYCYDEGLRCAMVVRLPPKWAHLAPARAGSKIHAPVSFIDLAPTLLSLAGIARPMTMQGHAFLGQRTEAPQAYAFGMRNRMDERYDCVRTLTDGRYRYVRNYMPHRPCGQNQAFAWLAKGYQDWDSLDRAGKLSEVQARFFCPRVYEEFYDVAADPDQIDTLIGRAEHAARIATMRRALDDHMLRINDNAFIPEGAAVEGYLNSRVAGAYPLKKVMALASAAARRDPRKLALFRAMLGDDNAVIRYWAATGLLILGAAAGPATADLSHIMQRDPSPYVRIVAAEAVAGLDGSDSAVMVLADLLGEPQPMPVRLQAINTLTYVGHKAKVALPHIRATSATEQEYVRNAARYLTAILDGSYTPAMPIFDMERMQRAMAAGKDT